MKKAAIITIYGNNNFGNKLQNYAVQEILKKYNLRVETIMNLTWLNHKDVSFKKYVIFRLKSIVKKILFHRDSRDCVDYKESIERQRNFLSFNQYLTNTRNFFSFFQIHKFNKYDYYFVGSDQVWNPNYGGISDFSLLTFTDRCKISLSASFGIDFIPEEYHQKIRENLLKFDGISVREDSGKKIIEDIVGISNVEVLVDPTMMLSKEEWNHVSKKPVHLDIDQKYILCYFLGGISDKRKNLIRKFAFENNCDIIDLFDKESPFCACGPSEFIYLESHATCICTDSFHSSVFAILYNKPFIVFSREGKHNNMFGRLTTLLNKFQLETQFYNEQERDLKDFMNINFSHANKILKLEQKKFYEFIDKNINKKI